VEVPEHVALQLEQLEGGEAGEGVGVYEGDEVVVQVEADQTHQTLEQAGVHQRQLVVTHLQDLGRVQRTMFGVGMLALTFCIAAAINAKSKTNALQHHTIPFKICSPLILKGGWCDWGLNSG